MADLDAFSPVLEDALRRGEPEDYLLAITMDFVADEIVRKFENSGLTEHTVKDIEECAAQLLNALYRVGSMWRSDFRIGAKMIDSQTVNLYWYRYVNCD